CPPPPRRTPRAPRLPYTTLFRSVHGRTVGRQDRAVHGEAPTPDTESVCRHLGIPPRTGARGDVAALMCLVGALVRGEADVAVRRSEEHTSELQSRFDLVCRLLLE